MQNTSKPSGYLLREMPRPVLFGKAEDIVAWCKENDKEVPTLLDLSMARDRVRGNRSKREKGKAA